MKNKSVGWLVAVASAILGIGLSASAYLPEDLEPTLSKSKGFREFSENPKAVEEYAKQIAAYYNQTHFGCETFVKVFARVKELSDKLPEFGKRLWKKTPRTYALQIFEAEPEAIAEPARSSLRIVSFTRKLHAIWPDPSQRNCLQETCDTPTIAAPERWLLGLDGSEVYAVEEAGKLSGTSLWVIPLKKGPRLYRMVYIVGPSSKVSEPRLYRVAGDSSVRRATLLDLWLEDMRRRTKTRGADLVGLKFEGEEVTLGTVISLAAGKGRGTMIGFIGDFEPADPLADKISQQYPRKCRAKNGEERELNLFGGYKTDKSKTASSQPGAGVAWNFKDPNAIQAILTGFDTSGKSSSLDSIPSERVPQLRQSLTDTLSNNPNPTLREKAAIALDLLNRKFPKSQAEKIRGVAGDFVDVKPSAAETASLKKALKDEARAVRDAAAVALANRGDKSPEVANQLSDAISGLPQPGQTNSTTDGTSSPTDRGLRAHRAKTDNDIPLTPHDQKRFSDWLDHNYNTPEGDRTLNHLAEDACEGHKPATLAQLRSEMRENPDQARRFLEKYNRKPCDCDAKKKSN